MKFKDLEEFILAKPGAQKTFPFDSETAVYKIAPNDTEPKIFALMPINKDPIRINLKCDPALAEHLRQQYETVMPGYHMNKRHWNTVVLTGQLTDQEVLDLVDHSYRLVFDSFTKEEQNSL